MDRVEIVKWLQLPVTVAVLEMIEANKKSIENRLLSGALRRLDPKLVPIEYSALTSKLEVLNSILDVERLKQGLGVEVTREKG